MSLAMTIEEREAFLAAPRVGVLSLAEAGRGPLVAPVWYDYIPGGVLWFLTQTTTRKGALLALGERLALTTQKDSPPYAYVSVEGPAIAIAPYDLEADLLPMASRYLGPDGGQAYIDGARPNWSAETSIKVTVQPERWLSADYAKR